VKPVAHISLFAGIGSIDLAAEREGIPTILTAEVNDWCRDLLHKRFPDAHHVDNVSRIGKGAYNPTAAEGLRPLMISGGFPCQDVSNIGNTQTGLAGTRSGLWSEFDRVIRDLQPEYVLIENVPALRKRGMDVILNDLYYAGYNAWWDCFPASYFGAPHERDRIWIQARRQDTLRFGGDAPLTDEAPLLGVLDRIPRAGRFIDGNLYEEPPQAPLSAVRRGSRWPMRIQERYCGERYPTPRSAANEWRTTKNAPSHGTKHGKTLAGEANDRERREGRTPALPSESCGNMSPSWVEWLMGLPIGWTDRRTAMFWDVPWGSRRMRRRTQAPVFERRARLMALGNATVPRVAQHAIQELLRRP
jgi:site-specific DNA-cytosine methylase